MLTRINKSKTRTRRIDPAQLYLDNLAQSGRRSMQCLLNQAIRLVTTGKKSKCKTWMKIRFEDVARIRAEMIRTKKSSNTINTTLAGIRGVLKTAVLMGQFSAQEFERIKSIPRVPGKSALSGRSLQSKEIRSLLKMCQRDGSAIGIRDSAMFSVLLYAGLRRSEAVALNFSDYTPRTGVLRIRSGKGNSTRQVHVPLEAREYVNRWIKVRGRETGPLFFGMAKNSTKLQRLSAQGLYTVVKRRAQQCRLDACSPHDLRRTFVTRLLDQGVDWNTTRQLAGHRKIDTTVLYDRRNFAVQKQAMLSLRF